jgi:hypothetical protein
MNELELKKQIKTQNSIKNFKVKGRPQKINKKIQTIFATDGK